MRDIRIEKTLNGYLVHVGCQRLSFETREVMIHELSRYLSEPGAVEKEYLSRFPDPGRYPEPIATQAQERYQLGNTTDAPSTNASNVPPSNRY